MAGINANSMTRTAASPVQTFYADVKMNELLSRPYETLPLRSAMPGYTGHQPGGGVVIGQRAAAAAHHTVLNAEGLSMDPHYQDLSLVDLRPEQRSMNKDYVYAEALKSNFLGSAFLQFPSKAKFDHRKL